MTECIWAAIFRAADAGAIGYAFVCFGDYGWTKGFSPELELVRTQTLMQDHDHCNHLYLWKG